MNKQPRQHFEKGPTKLEREDSLQQTRAKLEKHWLARAGSEREKQLLRELARQKELKELNEQNQALLNSWERNPKGPIDYNLPFWAAAKVLVQGPVLYEIAMKRHAGLKNNVWLVAYFTVQGKRQKEIAEEVHMSERMVDSIIRSLKDEISQELGCEVEHDGPAQIVRWFFGL